MGIVLLTALLLGAPQAAGREGSVTGTFALNGVPVAITHVYASAQPGFFDKNTEDIQLLFSNIPLGDDDRKDTFALIHLGRDGKARILEVVIDATGDPISGTIYAKEFDGSVSVTGMHKFTRERLDHTTIAGRLAVDPADSFMHVTFQYDVHFTAPIPRPPTAADVAASLASPAARAAGAYLAAVLHGTVASVIATMTPAASAGLRGADGAAELADLRADMPADTHVIGLEPQTDGSAIVEAEGHRAADGVAIGYTLHLVLDAGVWRVDK